MPEETVNETAAEQDSATTDAAQQEATDNPEEQADVFPRDYVEKLRAENAKYRTRAKELEEAQEAAAREAERAKMDELERAQAEMADLKKQLEERDQLVKAERAARTLAGKVVDPEAALRLAEGRDDLWTDDGPNVDAILETFPYLKPQPQATTAAPSSPPKGGKEKPRSLADAIRRHYNT